jgi:hypothetical protein
MDSAAIVPILAPRAEPHAGRPPQLLCAGACSGLCGRAFRTLNDAQEGGALLALARVRAHRLPTEQGPMPWHM